jgi:curli production assembly/transport component CsgG
MFARSLVALATLSLLVSGCSAERVIQAVAADAEIAPTTHGEKLLQSLPEARRKVAVSVYRFADQTGQHKSSDVKTEYSRAVTQGGLAILSEALLDAGNRNWFTVVERDGLANLLQERKLIRMMRDNYPGPDGDKLPPVGPLLYAGIMLDGGIISYETNVITGGIGAKYLGIGSSSEYRRDVVTVYLRAVSVQNGEVLLSVNTSKTIFSTAVNSNVFKFVAFDKILEAETGFTVNEPPQLAVRQAIEMAVYAMTMEGAMQGLWEFRDPNAGQAAINTYLKRIGKPVADTAGNDSLFGGMQSVDQNAPFMDAAADTAPAAPAMAEIAPQPIAIEAPKEDNYVPFARATSPSMKPASAAVAAPKPAPRKQQMVSAAPAKRPAQSPQESAIDGALLREVYASYEQLPVEARLRVEQLSVWKEFREAMGWLNTKPQIGPKEASRINRVAQASLDVIRQVNG